jgi:hypothetical protein
MTAAVAAVATAIAAVAGLVLYLSQTAWSAKARWETEYARLNDEFDKAQNAYNAAVAAGGVGNDSARLYAHWRLCATNLANHRSAGQRAGFLDRPE